MNRACIGDGSIGICCYINLLFNTVPFGMELFSPFAYGFSYFFATFLIAHLRGVSGTALRLSFGNRFGRLLARRSLRLRPYSSAYSPCRQRDRKDSNFPHDKLLSIAFNAHILP